MSLIPTSRANNTESYQFFNRSQQIKNSYFEFDNIIYANGVCGDLKIPPMQRICTPPLHVHLVQTELFTLIQGDLGYQMGDKVYSCNIHTCPKPLIIPPHLPHTIWMNDNKEDLIVRVRLEPANKYNGLRQGFFENYGGVTRDQHASMWQIFVLFENAQTYPASLSLPYMKTIFKIGALMGHLLGYKIEYAEYTTTDDD